MQNRLNAKAIGLMSVALLFWALSGHAQFSQGRLQATGLTCALCSKSIHQALGKLPFIESVQPDLKSSAFDLTFKSGLPVSVTSIRAAVEDAGFFIGMLTLQIDRDISEQERAEGKFIDHGVTYQVEGKINAQALVQVMDPGFVSDKEFRRMLSKYSYLAPSESATSVIHLLVKK